MNVTKERAALIYLIEQYQQRFQGECEAAAGLRVASFSTADKFVYLSWVPARNTYNLRTHNQIKPAHYETLETAAEAFLRRIKNLDD